MQRTLQFFFFAQVVDEHSLRKSSSSRGSMDNVNLSDGGGNSQDVSGDPNAGQQQQQASAVMRGKHFRKKYCFYALLVPNSFLFPSK